LMLSAVYIMLELSYPSRVYVSIFRHQEEVNTALSDALFAFCSC